MSRTIEKPESRSGGIESLSPFMPRWGWRLPEFMEWPDRRAIRIEESRSDGELCIRAEIPGIDPHTDVDLTLLDGVLTISAERREKHEDTSEGMVRSEFRYGSFMRQIQLPAGCSAEDIDASYENGILQVQIAVDGETPAAQHIEVRTTS